MGSILEDVSAGADWIAKALQGSGYKADFSPRSLWEIDRFIDEQARGGEPVSGGLLSEGTGQRLFAIGAYVGEVIRRAKGGAWQGDDRDPEAEVNVALIGDAYGTCWPVQRILKRFKLGPGEGIAAYGKGLGLDVGAKESGSPPPRKIW